MSNMNQEETVAGYSIEELIPIVGDLANRYTSYESSSVTYEKAEQLMEAVVYCIKALELHDDNGVATVGSHAMSAKKAYDLGLKLVKVKTKLALDRYNKLMAEFNDYGNRCLRDTIVKGMPEFFKWYDYLYCPQDTILTLDYPVYVDLSQYEGVERIDRYLQCIEIEQTILSAFSRTFVEEAFKNYEINSKDHFASCIENLVYILIKDVILRYSDQTSEGIDLMFADLFEEQFPDDEQCCMYMKLMIEDIKAWLKAVN